MHRMPLSIATLITLVPTPLFATAEPPIYETEPYFEYRVSGNGEPILFFTDYRQASTLLVQRYCARWGYRECEYKRASGFNSLYMVTFTRRAESNNVVEGTTWDYRYFTCDNPPALYVRYFNGPASGPFNNRTATPGGGGTYFCRSATPPPGLPDPDPEPVAHQSDLGPGDCLTHPSVGNPINAGLGNKFETATDIASTVASKLAWARHYNSGAMAGDEPVRPMDTHLGARWRGTYDRSLSQVELDAGDGKRAAIRLFRATGERIDYVETNGRYASTVDPRGLLVREGSGWRYRGAQGDSESYDADGRLVTLNEGGTPLRFAYDTAGRLAQAIDPQGRTLTFTYDSASRIASVHDGMLAGVTYTYDGAGPEADLIKATYADGTSVTYLYNEAGYNGGTSHPHALTGIVDETHRRYASFAYDKDGRAVSSEHALGTRKTSVRPVGTDRVQVVDADAAIRTYHYTEVRGGRRLTGLDQPGGAGCAASARAIAYDDGGNVAKLTDFDGRVTSFAHDADGRETERIDAFGTPQARSTRTEWHADLMKPTHVTRPGREDRFTYNDRGQITRYEQWGAIDPTQPNAPLAISRIWQFTYDTDGRLLLDEGPRSDTGKLGTLNRYTYRPADAANCANGPCDYRKGDLWKVENALGHAEEVLRYDGAGRVLSRRDALGLTTTYRYDARGRVLDVTEAVPEGLVSKSSFTYTPRGEVDTATDADGVTLRFTYDAARRLVSIHNPSNHWLRFGYDAMDRVTHEESYDGFNQLRSQLTRTYDALGRIASERDGYGVDTTFTYDERGRPTGVTDGDERHSSTTYDALGRLRERIGDTGGIKAKVTASHDPLDQLTGIVDPKGLPTDYLVTGLGDVAATTSRDTGESVDEHDVNGLVIQHEGAGNVGSYSVTRDALGRPLHVAYRDAAMDVRYTYDTADAQCPASERHATGLLSKATTTQGETLYCHDAHGRLTRKIQTWGGASTAVAYRYTAAGRLAGTTVVGGAGVDFRYDKDGEISGIDVTPSGGTTTPLISKTFYRAFQIDNWTYGNGRQVITNRDKNGRLTVWNDQSPDGLFLSLRYSPGGELTTWYGPTRGYQIGYDGLGRLTTVSDFDTYKELRRFDYDATGNRTAMSEGTVTDRYVYEPNSHRLVTQDGKRRTYDAAGNTTAIGNLTLTYDAVGRLASASENGRQRVSYGYDGEGQRIVRTETDSNTTTMYLLDPDGHWLADIDRTGKVIRQGIWMGDMLVGLMDGGKLYYVEPDHLGTPRVIVDPARNVTVWKWMSNDDPFGTNAPEEDPDGDGVRMVFDLRFPGQRYDAVTGLHANGARDYDAESGRYIQSDWIGLNGGISTYLYAYGSPLSYVDPNGNIPLPLVTAAIGALSAAVGDAGVQLYGIYKSGWCKDFNWKQLAISTAVGGAGGRILPIVSRLPTWRKVGGVIGLGSVTNTTVYLANGGDYKDKSGVAWAAGTGAVGGAIGGALSRISFWGYRGSAAGANLVNASNNAAMIRANTNPASLARGVGGATAASLPAQAGSDCDCQP